MCEFEFLCSLERMIQLAIAGDLPKIETIIVENSRQMGIGEYLAEKNEFSNLQELADYITKLAKSKEKITNIRIYGRIPS